MNRESLGSLCDGWFWSANEAIFQHKNVHFSPFETIQSFERRMDNGLVFIEAGVEKNGDVRFLKNAEMRAWYLGFVSMLTVWSRPLPST